MLAGERTLYPVGAVNRQFGEFTVEESRRTKLKDCTREDRKPNRRKGWMESWEENKEINQKQKKSFKEVKLKIIAIN
jgi:hypothetical protein